MPLSLIIGAGAVGTLFLLVLVALNFYVVVEPNKAHVVVFMGGGRKIYHPAREGAGLGSLVTALSKASGIDLGKVVEGVTKKGK